MEVMDGPNPVTTTSYDDTLVEHNNNNIDEDNHHDNDGPTVEESYEITTTTKRKTRTSYKIQEVSFDVSIEFKWIDQLRYNRFFNNSSHRYAIFLKFSQIRQSIIV